MGKVANVNISFGVKQITIPKGLLKGDVDGDGIVTDNDAETARKYILSIITLSADQIKQADMNNDGQVTLDDVISIRKQILGITQLDAMGNWTWDSTKKAAYTTITNPFGVKCNMVILIPGSWPVGTFCEAVYNGTNIKLYCKNLIITEPLTCNVINLRNGVDNIALLYNQYLPKTQTDTESES